MNAISKPFPQSYWFHERLLCAGCYPGDTNPATCATKIGGLLDCDIRRIINLMETNETDRNGRLFKPYVPKLQELARECGADVEVISLTIQDAHVPAPLRMKEILALLQASVEQHLPTYVHCWGGHGRTSTVVACYLMQQGHSAQQSIDRIVHWRQSLPKKHFPFEGEQEAFVRSWKPEPER